MVWSPLSPLTRNTAGDPTSQPGARSPLSTSIVLRALTSGSVFGWSVWDNEVTRPEECSLSSRVYPLETKQVGPLWSWAAHARAGGRTLECPRTQLCQVEMPGLLLPRGHPSLAAGQGTAWSCCLCLSDPVI